MGLCSIQITPALAPTGHSSAPAWIQDDCELSSGGPDRPSRHVARQQDVQKPLPPVAFGAARVRPGSEPMGLPVQRVCQENTLPVQVSCFCLMR